MANPRARLKCVVCRSTASTPIRYMAEIPAAGEGIAAVGTPSGWAFIEAPDGFRYLPACSSVCAAAYDPDQHDRNPWRVDE